MYPRGRPVGNPNTDPKYFLSPLHVPEDPGSELWSRWNEEDKVTSLFTVPVESKFPTSLSEVEGRDLSSSMFLDTEKKVRRTACLRSTGRHGKNEDSLNKQSDR